MELRLRISSAKIQRRFGAVSELASFCPSKMGCAIRGWRFTRERFENAIELRERLKPDRECDLANAKIRIQQQLARFSEPCAGDVMDKI